MASAAWTSTRTSPVCTGIGNGSAGGRPGPNRPSTSSAPPSLSGSAICVRNAMWPSRPDLKPGGGGGTSCAVVTAVSSPGCAARRMVPTAGPDGYRGWRQSARAGVGKQRGVRVASVTERVPRDRRPGEGMSMAQELAGMRVDYVGEGLDVDGLAGTWHEQLTKLLGGAQEAGCPEVNAMVLATAGVEGRPS